MQEQPHQARRASSEHVPPVASSGTRLRGFQGGVDVPYDQRRWTAELAEDFEGLDPKIQDSIIKIIGELRKISPERAGEAARRIGNFFHGVRDTGKNIKDLLDEISGGLEKTKKQSIQ